MLEPRALGLGMILRRSRSFGGLAAAIVPFGIVVHLIAEAVATERDGIGIGFILRHAYFAGLFALAALCFAGTLGIGCSSAERRRRCALVRADLFAAPGLQRLMFLVVANLGFFALTQAVEGNPIASGAVLLGLAIAAVGSLLSALAVFAFADAVIAGGLDAVIGVAPPRGHSAVTRQRARRAAPTRRATLVYSLFVPNRPPPFAVRF
jgi:hypothetical protein